MTAYVDFRFTSATGWTDSANAASNKVDGFAYATAGAAASTATLTLSAPSIVFANGGADPAVTGVQFELWLTRLNNGGTPIIDEARFSSAIGFGNDLGASQSFGEAVTTAPVLPITLGGETNLWGFSGFTYEQFAEDLTFNITGANTGSKTSTFRVWDVKGRIWMDILSMQDVVERAYRKANILSKDTTIEAEDLTHGLDLLNDMMFGWEIFGVDIGHVKRAAGEAFPMDRKFVEGTAMQLAERLSADYQVPERSADIFFRQLQAEYMAIAEADMPRALTRMPSRYWRDTRIR